MTNSEAVNWIINISADVGKAEHRDLWHYEQALSEIREMLESAQPEPQWIPCSEKQVEASCLACDKFGQMFIPTSIVVINHKCYDGTDFDFAKPDDFLEGVNIGHGMRVLPREIIAWMPLPEPYNGDE